MSTKPWNSSETGGSDDQVIDKKMIQLRHQMKKSMANSCRIVLREEEGLLPARGGSGECAASLHPRCAVMVEGGHGSQCDSTISGESKDITPLRHCFFVPQASEFHFPKDLDLSRSIVRPPLTRKDSIQTYL